MNAKQVIEQLKKDIEEIRDGGTKEIACSNLISYLDNLLKTPGFEPTATELEHYKAELQTVLESHKLAHAAKLEMFRSVISSGQGAIRHSFLMNGGASVALLAFIAHLAQIRSDRIQSFALCLVYFASGVLITTITAGATYLSQWFYASEFNWSRKIGFWLNILCIVLGLASYGIFVWGIYSAYGFFMTFTH